MQHTFRWFGLAGGLAVLGLGILACGKTEQDDSNGGELAVEGRVSQEIAIADDARAIAVGRDGRTFSTRLDGQRGFAIRVPVGQSYRVVLANPRREGGLVQVAHLSLLGEAGEGRVEWLGANEAGSVDLGTLVPVSSTPSGGDLGLRTYGAPPSGDHDDDDHDRDACHDDDGDRDLCTQGKETEVKPSKEPGARCKDHGKGKKKGHGKHHHPKPCSCTNDGGSGGTDGGSGGSDGGSGGGGGIGSECLSTSDCMLGLACVGGICRAKGGLGAECLADGDCMTGLVCTAGLCSFP